MIPVIPLVGLNYLFFAVYHDAKKNVAFDYAKSLTSTKGIVNLGATGSVGISTWKFANDPATAANVDIHCGRTPKCETADMNFSLPFSDKTFDVAFASHVLEHIDEWELALAEMDRVADNVVLALPHPLSLSGWLYTEHKQHFGPKDVKEMEAIYPTLKVF